jgi:hypothetical protein
MWNVEIVEVIFKKRSGGRGRIMEEMNQTGVQYICGYVTMKSLCNYHILIKMF